MQLSYGSTPAWIVNRHSGIVKPLLSIVSG